MNTERDSERFYDGILRRVLWGDAREDIMSILETNGISGDEADQLYRRARRERIASIRSIYWRRILLGIVLVVVGIALFTWVCHLTLGFRVYSVPAIILPASPAVMGIWKLLNGLVGVLTAASRAGSVSDMR